MARRYDYGSRLAGKSTPIAGGGIRVPARLTRTGVFLYRNADGSTRRELRLPEEVFKEDSLQTLPYAPVTDTHPKGLITAKDVKSVSVGVVTQDVKEDGRYVVADLVIQHHPTIEEIDRGNRDQISAAYDCDLEDTQGTWEGEAYDYIQRNIVYNHVALVPKGRAGPEVGLRLDAGDAFQVFENDNRSKEDQPMKFTIDGIQFDTESATFVQDILGHSTRKDAVVTEAKAEAKEAKAEAETSKGRADTLETENGKLKEDAKKLPADIDQLVTSRAKLHSDAKLIMGAEYDCTGKTDRDIKVAAIKHSRKDFDDTDISDDYLKGVFETMVAAVATHTDSGDGPKPAQGAIGAALPGTKPTIDILTKARKDHKEESAQAWKKPLAVSKQST